MKTVLFFSLLLTCSAIFAQEMDPDARAYYQKMLEDSKTKGTVIKNGVQLVESNLATSTFATLQAGGSYSFIVITPSSAQTILIDFHPDYKDDAEFNRSSGIITNPNGSKGWVGKFRPSSVSSTSKFEWKVSGMGGKQYVWYILVKI